jgi:hypothetical protein
MVAHKRVKHEGTSSVVVPTDDEYVALAPGLMVPTSVAVEHSEAQELPYNVRFLAVLRDRRFEIERLTVTPKQDGEPVTTEGLRQLPLARLVRAAVGSLMRGETGPGQRVSFPADVPPVPRGGPDEAVLQHVAAVYRLAHACHEPETKAVASRFGIPASTASKWVMKAREKKLLGPAPASGQSGEEG